MQGPAVRYLTIRSLGAPAVLLSLAMQGVFRGFKDTRTPLYATGKNNCTLSGEKNTSLRPSSQLPTFNLRLLLITSVSKKPHLTASSTLYFSGRRRSKHHTRPNFNVCLSHGCHWCSCFSRSFSVSFNIIHHKSSSNISVEKKCVMNFHDKLILIYFSLSTGT
jgi:hypothetical protein